MRYPKECPVFEVINEGRWYMAFEVGSHVEGQGIDSFESSMMAIDCVGPNRRGWDINQSVDPSALRPLTAAARDMIALVKP